MLTPLVWLRNAIDYPIRHLIKLRRGAPPLPAEPKDGLFPPAVQAEADRLVRTYGLERWARQSGRTDFAASLFYLQMLERALEEGRVRLPSPVTAVDAGCGDWFYVQALHGLLRHHGSEPPRTVILDGVEVDAWALYAGFRSRYDWAQAYAAGCDGATYLPQDIRQYRREVDLALMLFPFLFADDLRRWGLPRRYLRPGEYLRHVWGLLKPGGWLVVANLGGAERIEQHRLLAEAGIPIGWWGEHSSPLFAYEQPRYLTVARRPLDV
ncbi:MAG: hypothetical protein ACOY93_21055 [Bacillota bacterium]